MLKFYIDPLQAYAAAAKKAGGDKAVVIAGWGNRASENRWLGFYNLYKPTIDAAWPHIDGLCDHDYGGSPLKMPANYEVLNAYTVATYAKSMQFFNTETASNMDPQAHSGTVQTSGDAMKFQWVSRKIAHTLATVPDKCQALAHFGVGGGFWSDNGEGMAMDLMRNVRGRMLAVENPDPHLYVIASIDGTDERAPRADGAQVLSVLALNDRLYDREVTLTIHAPAGARLAKIGRVKTSHLNWQTGLPEMQESTIQTDGSTATLTVTMTSRAPLAIYLPLEQGIEPDASATVMRKQFIIPAILQEIHGNNFIKENVEIEPGGVAAELRLVVERLAAGEGQVAINGTVIKLPAVPTAENSPEIIRVPIPHDALKETNKIIISATDAHRAGFLVGMASLDVTYHKN